MTIATLNSPLGGNMITNAEVRHYEKVGNRSITQHYHSKNVKFKIYPDGSQVISYGDYRLKDKFRAEAKRELEIELNEGMPKKRQTKDDYSRKDEKDSGKRAKDKIMDLAKSNEWGWFGTLTLDKTKIDRYDYAKISESIKKLLHATRKRMKDVKYLIVPEQHKDGAWHFHILLTADGFNRELIDSGRKDAKGRTIYNWEKYEFGFTEFTKIDDSCRASSYLAKYVTKVNKVPKGKKKYWSSKDLKKPTLEYTNMNDATLQEYISIADYVATTTVNMKIVNNGVIEYVEKHYVYITLNKPILPPFVK